MLTLQILLYIRVSAFILETSISENMVDLKERGCILTLTFICNKISIPGLKKIGDSFLENRM